MMRSNTEIARRIAKIIMSPESVMGFVDGILSVPKDIGYLAYGFMDTDTRFYRETEKIRMVGAIRYGILQNHNFMKTIEIVLREFNKVYLNQSKMRFIAKRLLQWLDGL